MPSSLTDASRRWVVIADRHPGLDSTAIFKLTVFAGKVQANDRKLDRLVREATRDGYDTDKIADTAGVSTARVLAILSVDPDDTNRPRESRVKDGTAIGDLEQLAGPLKRHEERREWWVDRAAKQGWDVADIAEAALLDRAEVERLAAEELQRRREQEARRCSFCGKNKDEVSVYCKHAATHALAVEARQEADHRAFLAKLEAGHAACEKGNSVAMAKESA